MGGREVNGMRTGDQETDAQAQGGDVILVENLEVAYGETTILKDVSFSVEQGEILTILGASGCGKTTLLRAMTGLIEPVRGSIHVAGEEITGKDMEEALSRVRRQIGVLFQSGALLQSLTIAENVALPLDEFTDLPPELKNDIVQTKLNLVRLGETAHLMPAELSGGMQKRAGLARSMVLDPKILFCDEPAAGLDPITAREVDELLLELNEYLGVTIVVVTHELASIHNISRRCIMLDAERKGIIAKGTLESLKDESEDERVRAFFNREIDKP